MRCTTTLIFTVLLVLPGCKNPEGAPARSQAATASDGTTAAVATVSASAPNNGSANTAHPNVAMPPKASASPVATTSAGGPASGTVHGWSEEVTLTGTLIEKEVLSAKGGSIKTTFLKLDAPIGVHDDKSGEKLGNYDGERELWYARDGKPVPPGILGKRVTFRGRLNPMQTAHHHSNVWLTGEVTPSVR
jgi:hypothetical protein